MILPKISFQTLWKVIKIVLIIQVFNAVMDYFMWVSYGYLIPSWTIATLNVFYTVLIISIKIAQERATSAPCGLENGIKKTV